MQPGLARPTSSKVREIPDSVADNMRTYLVKRLQRLGYQVTLTPQTDAA